ncbi:MAG: hypothetical protein H0T62_11505 [Parachlamydiaceae bacterium]|nr:hypothetical protein [Parachlamydiaceae bacterium]
MNVPSICYNPLALATARSAWEDQESSLPTKICKGVVCAAYDIFLKNPYELTIGNISKVIHNPDAYSTMTKIAVCAVAVFTIPYTLILYGSTIYLCGHCIEVLGSNIGLEVVTKVGGIFQSVGNNIFLAGATPLYAVFYALPKYILESIPKIATFLSEKVALASDWIFQYMLTPLWNGVALLATKVGEVATTICNFITSTFGEALEAISTLISSVATWTLNHVLTPLWENALQPCLIAIGRSIFYLTDKFGLGLHVVKTAIENTAQWLFTNAIEPLWINFTLPSLKLLSQGISYLSTEFANVLLIVANRVTDAAQWIIQSAIIPAWNLFMPVFKAVGRSASLCANYVGQSIQMLAEVVSLTAYEIFQKMIAPAFNAVLNSAVTVGTFFNNHVIGPVGTSLASLIVNVSEILNQIFLALGKIL